MNTGKVMKRQQEAKLAYDDLLVRCTKNFMTEQAFCENIKMTKHEKLPDRSTFSAFWYQLKDSIEKIEVKSRQAEQVFKQAMDTTKAEIDEYQKTVKSLEDDMNKIEKKVKASYMEMQKRKEKYIHAFREWDMLDSQYTREKSTLDKPALTKLEKQLKEKTKEKNSTERAYIDGVSACQKDEYERDKKMLDFLQKSEHIEVNRMILSTERLQNIFGIWNDLMRSEYEELQQCQTQLYTIDARTDAASFANDHQYQVHREPYTQVQFPSRANYGSYNYPPTPPVLQQVPIPDLSGSDHFTPLGNQSTLSHKDSSFYQSTQSNPEPSYATAKGSASSYINHSTVGSISSAAPSTSTRPGVPMVVICDYVAQGETEISCLKGEKVSCLNMDEKDGGWALVRKQTGQEGFVAFSYLAEESSGVINIPSSAFEPAHSSSLDYSGSTGSEFRKGIAIYDYEPQSSTELRLQNGEVVRYKPDADDWCYCVRDSDGAEGYAPKSYIQDY
ncbi:hypothetical protein BLNAU_15789 [Blattamonas nauphoetae]|uniref:SH3 domain-containing protein n=1 Tax=Blattamonas nauphoetae TaxID=2049346 RepID=A0ABQ9XDG1_9EUKA|nr:hypothetical protein BLNAU_15789 [Blattamonas nauphoetae]